MLYIRMFLYFLSAALAGQGVAVFDAEAGTLTFQIDSLAQLLTGVTTFAGTFVTSRVAKARGGAT